MLRPHKGCNSQSASSVLSNGILRQVPMTVRCRVQRAVDWICGLGRQLLAQADEAAVTLARHILVEPTPPGVPLRPMNALTSKLTWQAPGLS